MTVHHGGTGGQHERGGGQLHGGELKDRERKERRELSRVYMREESSKHAHSLLTIIITIFSNNLPLKQSYVKVLALHCPRGVPSALPLSDASFSQPRVPDLGKRASEAEKARAQQAAQVPEACLDLTLKAEYDLCPRVGSRIALLWRPSDWGCRETRGLWWDSHAHSQSSWSCCVRHVDSHLLCCAAVLLVGQAGCRVQYGWTERKDTDTHEASKQASSSAPYNNPCIHIITHTFLIHICSPCPRSRWLAVCLPKRLGNPRSTSISTSHFCRACLSR